jgi:hypothetical protein
MHHGDIVTVVFTTAADTTTTTTRIAQWYSLDDRGFESRQGVGTFLFTTASRPALGPTHPPIQWVSGAPSLWGKAAEA